MDQLKDLYFDWMCDKVLDRRHPYVRYSDLMNFLHSVEFKYSIDMDANRYEDGIDLRYRFAYENAIDNRQVASEIDIRFCSILEMMVALSIRIEEGIMDNPDCGNRTPYWFWEMISNLGLSFMSNDRFDPIMADDILESFTKNDYLRNGVGGLFRVDDPKVDMRKEEIWVQAMWHLNDVLEKGG